MPQTDAPVVSHLKQAGAIPIGRTNLPDFGLRWHTNNDLRGTTLNPWDPSRTPGGSSGGEAVAIATGMSPLGVGNDMGGSLRYPSQCCGITALKPTFGRVSRIATSIFPDPPLFYDQFACVNGPMARHVQDLRLALDIMSQPDPRDPWWTPWSFVENHDFAGKPVFLLMTGNSRLKEELIDKFAIIKIANTNLK
jgi:amidase